MTNQYKVILIYSREKLSQLDLLKEDALENKHTHTYVIGFDAEFISKANHRSSFEKSKKFTHSRIGWISKHLLKIQLRPKIQLFDKPVDKQIAKEFLEGRIKELADKFGFVLNKVTILNVCML